MGRFQALCLAGLFSLLPVGVKAAPGETAGVDWQVAASANRPQHDVEKGEGLGGIPGTFLTSGDTVTFGLPAVNQPTIFLEGFRIEVPPGGHDRLEIDVEMLSPSADVVLFVRFGQDVEVPGGSPVSDYEVNAPSGGKQLVITPDSTPALKPGTYFIALGLVTTGRDITARITATVSGGPPVAPVGVRLTNGVPRNFSIPAVAAPAVVAGFLGFRIDVPDGASRLRIDAQVDDPNADIQILVQRGFDVALFSDGTPLADELSPAFGPSQRVSVTLNSQPAVMRGTYWIGLGLQSVGTEFNGSITASIDLGAQTPPTIELSRASLDFLSEAGVNPPIQQFKIRNAGDGTLNYLVAADESWVQINTTAGASSGEEDPVNVSIETAGLAAGERLATITVSRSDFSEPVRVRVRLVLTGEGPPAIGLAPGELTFNILDGAGPELQPFSIRNSGGGVLDYEITDNVPWLSISPSEGTSSGESDAITATANPAGLGPGTYTGQIQIRDTGEGLMATLMVTLNIADPPRPAVTVQDLSFEAGPSGQLPPEEKFKLANAGHGVLNYVISTSQPWLMVDPSSGAVTTSAEQIEVDTITVTVNPFGLSAGTHHATITISSAAKGGPGAVVIAVSLVLIGDLTPFIRQDGVVNAATFAGPELEAHAATPGSIVSIFGDNMTLSTEAALAIPLPTELGGVRVVFDDGVNDPMEAALFLAFAGGATAGFDQINAQMPWGLDTSSGFVTATVFTGEKVVSPPRMVPVAEASPGIFTFEFGGGLAAIQNFKLSAEDDVVPGSIAQPAGSVCPALGIAPDDCMIDDQPAAVGGVIVIFANGLGLLDGVVETGDIPPAGPPLQTVKEVRVWFGPPGNQVQGVTLFSGLQSAFVGLNQINAIVPDIAPGDAVPIQIEVVCDDGTTIRSRSDVTIAVRPAP
ncbi:MAG TPA: hypothetical protein VML01_08030 [Bryobacterales bacterium]|nr:hypothetical protein [Bryobacterales bacterium]